MAKPLRMRVTISVADAEFIFDRSDRRSKLQNAARENLCGEKTSSACGRMALLFTIVCGLRLQFVSLHRRLPDAFSYREEMR